MKTIETLEQVPQALNQICLRLAQIERAISTNEHQETESPGEDLLNVDEAATFLSLTKSSIYRKVSRKEIPYMKEKNSKRVYFSKQALIEQLKGNSFSPTSQRARGYKKRVIK